MLYLIFIFLCIYKNFIIFERKKLLALSNQIGRINSNYLIYTYIMNIKEIIC